MLVFSRISIRKHNFYLKENIFSKLDKLSFFYFASMKMISLFVLFSARILQFLFTYWFTCISTRFSVSFAPCYVIHTSITCFYIGESMLSISYDVSSCLLRHFACNRWTGCLNRKYVGESFGTFRRTQSHSSFWSALTLIKTSSSISTYISIQSIDILTSDFISSSSFSLLMHYMNVHCLCISEDCLNILESIDRNTEIWLKKP